MPSGGNALFGALVRIVIQWALSQGLAGIVRSPVKLKVPPACSCNVSPQDAALIAVCRLAPDGTWIVAPGLGVLAISVCRNTRGNSAGPSNFPEADWTETFKVKL